MSSNQSPNHLARETSPYLLQHADNPVNWYPWGEEAFAKARAEDKPILLSVGYSACHWCHVMAHESFEDEETAELMNRLFVNVKLDREERPDIDKIYQASQTLITRRHGGWPLTMFLDPRDRCPFFGGTYFPREPRHNLPPFKEILRRVHAYYTEHREDIHKQNNMLKDALHKIYAADDNPPPLSPALAETARAALAGQFDQVHGGFGDEPKFPHSERMQFMLRCSAHAALGGGNDPRSEYMALYTLDKMCRGGLYDQLGGGFYRYSVDAEWQIPHFEKMLYDNGPLLGLLAEASRASDNARFAEAAHGTAQWVLREMQAPEGGYYATLDADSEGGEGAFYAWRKDEVSALLDADDAELAARHFGLDQPPNFEGKWHLRIAVEADKVAAALDRDVDTVRTAIARAGRTLLAHREQRPRPGRDDKILPGWNALMIKGMAQAARQLGNGDYYRSAARALDFVRATLWHGGQLAAGCKDGRIRPGAYLDDYAFLLDAIFHVLQYRWRDGDFAFALNLADAILERFEDSESGGYFFTAHDHEQLIQRPRELHDEATPSGYGVAALALARFGLLCGNDAYLASTARALKQAATTIANAPSGCISLLHALDEQREPPEIVIIRFRDGTPDDVAARWRDAAVEHYSPFRFCFMIPDNAGNLPPSLRDKRARGDITAYPCRGASCLAPIDELDAFTGHLADGTPGKTGEEPARKTLP